MLKALLALTVIVATPTFAAEWTYTDGAGKTVTLPEAPQRIVAHINSAAALIPLGIRPVGIFIDGPPAMDLAMDGLDLTDVDIIQGGWFDLNAEQLLALEPDLILTEWSSREQAYNGAVGEAAIAERIESIAPVVGVAQGQSILGIIEDYEALAESLGADPAADSEDKATFEAALARFKAGVSAKPGLTVMAVSPSSSSLSIAVPGEFAELSDFKAWGLDLVEPQRDADSSYQTLSWENANLYPADLLLVDDRWGRASLDAIAYQPLAQRLPAVAAGQLDAWPAGWIRNYRVYAEQLDKLSEVIEASDADVVE